MIIIRVYNSDVYFIIRNCTLYNGDNGILLIYVTNAQIINNPIENNKIGIFLNFSNYNTIKSNNIYNNSNDGINLCDSISNYIYNNSIYENFINGIHMVSGLVNYFVINNITENKRGIYFVNSFNNTIVHP